MPIIILQPIIIIPFIIMQQLTMLPLSIVQRFWSMPADTLSSQTQVSFIPPSHSSIFMVQRGMTIMFMPVVPVIGGFMVMPIPGIIICRSIVIIMRIVSRNWLVLLRRTMVHRQAKATRKSV
jgi:hypothetical protein